MTQWKQYRRKGGKTPEPVSLIGVRRNQIALNAHFISTANLETMSHACIFIDPEMFRLGFQFHEEAPNDDAIALTNDGGGRGRGRCIQIAGLMRDNPWLAAVSRIDDPKLRRFEPKWIGTDSMWVISLCPSFEHQVSDRSDIPSTARGIYRYKRNEEIVYIGRGEIRSRLRAQERKEWDFETIEYSLIQDESMQIKWETFWIDRFVEQHNKLPLYNRIAGKGVNHD